MKTSMLFLTMASLSALASASPLFKRQANITNPTNFYLVTTDEPTSRSNSSFLENVSLTTLFDPYYQTNYFLRTIEPGYGSVPTFNLTDGVLHSRESGPHGLGTYIYNSTDVHTGSELQFTPSYQGQGDLSLDGGYLLAVNGSTEGWTICPGDLEQTVVEYKGTDEGCTPTYLQAVTTVPY